MTGQRGDEGAPPRCVTEPRPVIIDIVTVIDPTLTAAHIDGATTRVAPARAQRRRLAQALHEQPELLTSGRSDAPRAVDRLIDELLPLGTGRLVALRCARWHEPRELKARDGDRRICGRCDQRRRTAQGRACQRCGRTGGVARRRRTRVQLRRRCVPRRHDDPLTGVSARIARLEPDLDREVITDIVQRAI
jgi:hypothetical protein